MKFVGTTSNDYGAERNILDVKTNKYKKIVLRDKVTYLNLLSLKLTGKYRRSLFYIHLDFARKKISLYHFFNTISFGSTPWITTFESYVPRWGIYTNLLLEFGVKQLASPKCVKLIAISKCSYKIQENFLRKYPKYKEAILNKTIVLYPPQVSFFNTYEEKYSYINNDYINFTLIGNDFYVKGGREILQAFIKLIEEGTTNIRLNIVSTLRIDVFSRAYILDNKFDLELINKYRKYINIYTNISNEAVIELLKKSHVGLLPSYADTFGYSVLEAQACGCPVITTNVRALPEINNNEIGWTIKLPLDALGFLNLQGSSYKAITANLYQELYSTFKYIIENPSIISKKGKEAMEKIRIEHSPQIYAEKLSEIYNECTRSS